MIRASLILAVLLLGGCAHSDATRFWTLDPIGPERVEFRGPVVSLRVDAVRVPRVLDRLEVVQQTSGGRVVVRDFDRWSAPLGALIKQTLTQDLLVRLPPGAVIFPEAPKTSVTLGLVVDVLDLRPSTDGYAMEVSWAVLAAGSHTPLQGEQIRLQTPRVGPSVDAQAAATSRLAAQLADRIASRLAGSPRPG